MNSNNLFDYKSTSPSKIITKIPKRHKIIKYIDSHEILSGIQSQIPIISARRITKEQL